MNNTEQHEQHDEQHEQCKNIKEHVAKIVIDNINECESMTNFLKELGTTICKCENSKCNINDKECKKWCIITDTPMEIPLALTCNYNLRHELPRTYCKACTDAYTMPFSKDPICHDCYISQQEEYKCHICKQSNFKVMLTKLAPPIVVTCKNCNIFI